MKANIKTALVLLSLSFSAQAQVSDFEVEWGEKIEAKRTLASDIFSNGEPNTFFAINTAYKIRNSTTVLEKFENLKPVKEQELTVEYSRGDFINQDVLELNNNLYAMEYHKTRENISLKAQYINPEDLSITNEKIDIYNFKLTQGRNQSYGEYRQAISNDEKRVAFIIEHPGDDESKSVATIKVFDDEFEMIWKNKITLSSTKENTKLYSVDVGNNGVAHILTKVYRDKKDRERDERNYEFYLLTVDKTGLISEEKLELKSNYIKDLKLDIGKNGELLCAGFYSIEGFRNDGVFYMTLDAENYSVRGVSMKKFDIAFITDGNGKIEKNITKKRADKGKDIGLKNIDFRDIIVKENGGALIIGEYYNSYTTMQTDANGSTTTTWHYHYDDIYVVSISPAGKIDWSIKIRKDQYSKNDHGMFSSFFLILSENKLHIIFNDNLKNAGVLDYQDILKYNGRTKKSALMMVSVDSEGKYTREVLVDPSMAEGIRLRPKSCEQISEDEFILFAMSKKFNKYARVKVK